MKKRIAALLGTMILVMLVFSGCTSAFTNASTYFSNTGTILGILFSSGNTNSTKETVSNPTKALDAPENFSVDPNGEYSFDAVDGASYYLLYFCEPTATEDGDDFLFSSEQIPSEDSVSSYSGNLNDLIDYGYGSYLVKVFAFPELGDSEYAMSSAASTEYALSGVLEEPQIAYFWNTFDNTLDMQLDNIDNYTYQVYPDEVTVTFTNVEDASDQVIVTMEAPTPENSSASTDALTRGMTYNVTAVGTSSSEYVTNPTTDTAAVGQNVTFGEINVITDGYTYTDNIKGELAYPRVCLEFNLENGGSIGSSIGTYGPISFNSTPIEASADALYTYEIEIQMQVWGDMVWTLPGTLNLNSDGTFLLQEFGMKGPVPPSAISGIWMDNGDGTATLSYDPSTVTVG